MLSAADLAGVERLELDGVVRIHYRGVPVLSYDADDPVARDFVIATLLRVGLSGKSAAALCKMSQAHVTGVRQRVAAGGTEALAVRGKGGTPRKLTGRKLTKLRRLDDAGWSLNRMAKELGVSWETVQHALQRLGRPTRRSERAQRAL